MRYPLLDEYLANGGREALFGYAMELTRENVELADDLVQDTIIRAMKWHRREREDPRPKSCYDPARGAYDKWLRELLRWIHIEQWERDLERATAAPTESLDAALELSDDSDDPEAHCDLDAHAPEQDRVEQKLDIERAIASLEDPRDRIIARGIYEAVGSKTEIEETLDALHAAGFPVTESWLQTRRYRVVIPALRAVLADYRDSVRTPGNSEEEALEDVA